MKKHDAKGSPEVVTSGRRNHHHLGIEFLNSGLAAVCAITIMNPLDVVRTRLQIQTRAHPVYRGIGDALQKIARQEGWRGLQRGLTAAWYLQFTNCSIRFGLYNVILKTDDYVQSVVSAALAGACGTLVSCPFFLLKNRIQAGHEPPRGLSVHQALGQLYQQEGVQRGLYRGLSAFMPRVVVASTVQLSTYDLVKRQVLPTLGDTVATHFISSLLTGIAVVMVMQPFDIAATLVMTQQPAVSSSSSSSSCSEDGKTLRGKPYYAGPMDALVQVGRKEGLAGIYKGAGASYARFGPYCILVFVFLEQFRDWQAPAP